MMRDLMRDFSPLADFQAAGAVGNGGSESGGFTQIQELHPTAAGSKGGLGFFQWTGMGSAAKPGRRRVFEKLLKEMNRGPDSYDANYEMLRRELKDSEKATIRKLRTAKDIDEATKFFMVSFERPGIPHYEGRVKWSKMALAAYESEEKKIAKDPPVVAAKA
jgi:tail lysozyme